jgi:dipeptidyl aminopeptidase/acylaminoacyl peptidase
VYGHNAPADLHFGRGINVSRSLASTKRPLTADDLFHIFLESDPHVSPDGRHVAWVQTRLSKDKDLYESAIWIAEATGGNARQLTSGKHRDQSPRWSPDNATIAFISNRPYILPLPATANDERDENDTDPKDQDEKPAGQVWTIRIDGGEAMQQSNHPNGASDPAWAPDGSIIAFMARDDVATGDPIDAATSIGPIADERLVRDISYRFDGQGFLDRYAHIWTTVAGSGTSTQLTFGDANDGSPAWSPDGSSIAFTSNRSTDRKRYWNRKAVHVIRIGDSAITTLTPEDAQFSDPAWSPNGDRLALIGHLGTGSATNDDIWTVGVDGQELVNHSEGSDISFGDSGMSDVHMSSYQGPRWHNDSTLLALASRGGETQVFRVFTGKHRVVQVTEGEHRISGFSPLGDKLAVIRGTTARPFALEVWSGNGPETVISTANDAFLSEVELIEAQEIPVTSADGTPIQASGPASAHPPDPWRSTLHVRARTLP